MTYTCFDGLVFFLIGSKVRVRVEDIWAERETVAALDTEKSSVCIVHTKDCTVSRTQTLLMCPTHSTYPQYQSHH